ncbi:uncharacterized protein At1g05835-like [Malus sylvestris]|uniref:uncharacterized protein At1g05835-like n=1 Tax=Malus sylvestris TaxID=3752 RepID=UPI0021ABB716|nr:uncharacterized protein At1g05835-like [Malus sylvestris]
MPYYSCRLLYINQTMNVATIHLPQRISVPKRTNFSEMAALVKSFIVILLFSLINEGMCQEKCATIDLQIRQEKTGNLVQAKPEFQVRVLNACPCLQGNVTLDCNGFQTVEVENPVTLLRSGNECLLNNGSFLTPFNEVVFVYAWDTQFPFKPLSSNIKCD